MKHTKYIIIPVVLLLLAFNNKQVFSWGLFDLFNTKTFSQEQLKKIATFNPDKDILYLPKLKGKPIFQSIDDLSITRRKDIRKYIYIYLRKKQRYPKGDFFTATFRK